MPEIKLNLRANLLRLFRYLSAIILNSLTSFERSLLSERRRDWYILHRFYQVSNLS
ncbi:hypothetical protein [Orientia tsutsugamushi]|uniref:hypothetical protein n=1 Tax=Orientia tsutsugamushi TaxID=784 RepID=UPI004046DCCC